MLEGISGKGGGIRTEAKEKNGLEPFFIRGSASGNRTLDSAVRGRRLDLLTNAPHFYMRK